jgi:hypothetical protein
MLHNEKKTDGHSTTLGILTGFHVQKVEHMFLFYFKEKYIKNWETVLECQIVKSILRFSFILKIHSGKNIFFHTRD